MVVTSGHCKGVVSCVRSMNVLTAGSCIASHSHHCRHPWFLHSVNMAAAFPSPLNVCVCVNPFFPLFHGGNYPSIIIRSKPTSTYPNQTTSVCVRWLVLSSNLTEKSSLALLPKESGQPTQVWREVKIKYRLTHELFILPHKQID